MTACVPLERLARANALTAAEREHVAACTRCATLLAEYEAFAEGSRAGVSRADLSAAEEALAATIDRELPATPVLRRVGPAAGERRAWWLGAPGRMALAAAALVIVAGTFVVMRERPAVHSQLRGGEATPLALVAEPGTKALALRWVAWAGADGYRVEIVSVDLQPLATFGPVRGTSFTLVPGAVGGAPTGTDAWCRIIALRAGAAVGESEPLPIHLP
jgi:hypothetical protein